ncbi:hypothetical protein MESS2_900003 [Mesorhizobium metallidurans STM 2683]|uniref:Uncharacterized protein n=1 Tax=Mesorhizobium metallidurans STM 2683 TaxID=1297569 RepID=M5EYT5_9HYPH|nr:hypothetical protein MESS2_900003 [Mesorhizobium metallidurans STM 2683]
MTVTARGGQSEVSSGRGDSRQSAELADGEMQEQTSPHTSVADGIRRCALREGRAQRATAGQAEERIIAHLADGFQRHLSGALHGAFVVLFEQDRANQADDDVIIWEDADDLGAPLDLAVEALDRVGRVQLGAVLLEESHVDQHVGLGVVHDCRQLRHPRPDLEHVLFNPVHILQL